MNRISTTYRALYSATFTQDVKLPVKHDGIMLELYSNKVSP